MNSVVETSRVPGWLRPAPDSLAAHMRRAGSRPALQALHLLWSAWVFCTPLFTSVDAAFYWSLLISYPVFVLLFALVYVRPCAELGYYATALVLLACACMPFNPAAWSYGVFACVYVPYRGSLLASAITMVFFELLMMLVGVWLGWPWPMLAVLGGVCSSAGFGALTGRIHARKNAAERMSRDEVRRLAANAERERIGRDLHDLLGHTLSLITLKLELSRKLFDRDPDRARDELRDAEDVARHALAEVRAAVTGIRATGLAGELASARLMLKTSDVELRVGDMPALPDALDDTLALVLREAVTNIHRHAQARHASVAVELADGHVEMRVHDDGRGGADAPGNGLNGMRERVAALDGSLRIRSSPNAGTELRVVIPLPATSTASIAPDPDTGETMRTEVVTMTSQIGDRS
ncbi:MAG TPA: sensor histidine kinase [Oleiagrimonas sp.]|nr:sensor histidine kinase [Oleiagrimonas sp.]